MRIASRIFFSILLVLTFTGTALPWGNGPTHFSIGCDVTQLITIDHEDIFIRANSCPDIGNTQLFKSLGLDYVHTAEFAKYVYQVAINYSVWYPEWLSMAYGYASHMISDAIFHPHITPEEPTHQLIELSIDTIYFNNKFPLRGNWRDYNVGPDFCEPWLIYLASRRYKRHYDSTVSLAYPWRVQMALGSLRTTIEAEYCYIEAKGGDDLSWWFVERMIDQNNLDESWEDYYDCSVMRASEWIDNPSFPLPSNSCVISD